MENFRRQQSQITEQDLSEELKKKLFPGIKSMQGTLDRLEASNTLKAITVCITTQQIGFAVSHIFISLRQFNNIPVVGDIYQFYRVGLAILEAKMLIVQRSITLSQENNEHFDDIPANENFISSIKTVVTIPDQLTSVTNAIGVVKTNDRN